MKTFNRNNPQFFLLILISLLLLACGKSSDDARKELGQMNIEYSEASFIKCAERGDSLAVKLFLESGMNPNSKDNNGLTPLMMAAKEGRENVVSLLLQNKVDLNARDIKRGISAIIYAAGSGNLNTVKLLLTKGSPLDDKSNDGITPLMSAVLTGNNVELVKYLIKNGALINAKDNDGKTTLLLSINMFSRNIDIVRLLLVSGADINATDKNGNTALMGAIALISEKSNDIIELLLKSGAKVNGANNKGETALHECVNAIIFGLPYRIQLVGILLKNGANPNIENIDGKTPIDILKQWQQEINLKHDIRQIISNLIDNLIKAAIESLPDTHTNITDTKRENITTRGVILKIVRSYRNHAPDYRKTHNIFLKNKFIYTTGSLMHIESKYITDNADVILIMESTGGNSCPGFFRLIIIKDDGSFSISSLFGNCYETPIINQSGNVININFPFVDMDRPKVTVLYDNGIITIKGMTKKLINY